MEVTQGHLLGGRLRYAQPKDGYRTGIEPVLLAASVPARPGERVLEAGTGAGAGLMCLAARVPGVVGAGVEIDPAMAELARRNIAANGFDGLEIVTGDVARLALGPFDHAFANPPWHDERSSGSPIARRRRAKQESGPRLAGWIAALARMLKPGGSLTLILPAAQIDRACAAAGAGGLGEFVEHPLLPKNDRPAKLALLQSRRGYDRPGRVAAGTVLHLDDGAFTPMIDAVLRQGEAMVIAGAR